jgi:hypothetical protein
VNPVVSSVKKKDIFTGQLYNERDVTGDTANLSLDRCCPRLAQLIVKLLPDANKHSKTHAELDRYALAFHLSCVSEQQTDWRPFVANASDVFSLRHMPDIGSNIRNIIYNQVQRDTMTRIIFFSLPFLKHNRLSLPHVSEITLANLQDLVRIILACYLGMLQPGSKTPTWILRVQILVFAMQLLTRGTKQDLYTFCLAHQATLRISCIEYFIHFLQTNMLPELSTFAVLFVKSTDTDALQFAEILAVINNFRVSCYTTTKLDTAEFNTKALGMLERCNRICVTKLKHRTNDAPAEPTASDKVLALCLHAPYTQSVVIAQTIQTAATDAELDQFMHLQHRITRYALPEELLNIQLDTLQDIASRSAIKAVNAAKCHICFRCGLVAGEIDTKMRLTSTGQSICSQCRSTDFVFSIFAIGNVISCGQAMLFWCPLCRVVHAWQASGHDFRACALRKAPRRHHSASCFMCHKQVALENVRVLDARVGVLHTLALCYKHRPWEFQTKWIHDVESFCEALKHKKRSKPIY